MTPREAFLAAWPFSVEANIVGEEADRALAMIDKLGFAIVPKELTPAIACALEMCAPPEAQTPGALEQLVKDYREVWSHVLAAANANGQGPSK